MYNALTRHAALGAALALPVLLILGIIAAVYLRQLFQAPPTYALLYRVETHRPFMPGEERCRYTYRVEGGRLQAVSERGSHKSEQCDGPGEHTSLYRYEPRTDTHSKISFSEASRMTLDPARTAPDGYTFERGHRAGPFELFGGRERDGWLLSKNGARYRVTFDHLPPDARAVFVGWIRE